MTRQLNRFVLVVVMLLPSLLIFFLYRVVPLIWNVFLSLGDWNFIKPWQFVGIENYVGMMEDQVFWESLGNLSLYIFFAIPVSVVFALFIAFLVNAPIRGQNAYRAIIFMPYPMTPVAIGMIWKWLYNEKVGLINYILRELGIVEGGIGFLSSGWAFPSVIFTMVWHVIGYYMVIILAGMQTIPDELYECAELDGATDWTKMRFITLPLLRASLFLCFIVGVISSFQLFDIIHVMTGGGPGYSTEILITYIYKNAFTYGEVGYASAITVVMFLLLVGITIVVNTMTGGEAGGGQGHYE